MNKLILTTLLALAAAQTFAMPTKAELTKAQPLVVELMAPVMSDYKAAKRSEKAAAAAKVGDASAEFAKAAETEAAKFLLLKGAVSFYARGEQYDKAAETMTTLQREIKDVPPAVIAEITGKATGRISETKAPALYALYRTAKLQVRASEEAKSFAAKLKKAPSDALQRKYAEALAVSGDWKSAYAEFAKVRDTTLQAIVKDESSGSAKNAEAGEFWWAYEPAMEDAEDFFKSHAAAFYRKALDAGEITGLKKNIIEQRIKDISAGPISCAEVQHTGYGELENFSIDIGNGSKIEFVACPAGTFTMGYENQVGPYQKHKVKISRPFWISKYLITIEQWRTLMGREDPFIDRKKKANKPVWLDSLGGIKTPTCGSYDDYVEFMWQLSNINKKKLPTGYVFRFPSEAEWEYACKANAREGDIYSKMNWTDDEFARLCVPISKRLAMLQKKVFKLIKARSKNGRSKYLLLVLDCANRMVGDSMT